MNSVLDNFHRQIRTNPDGAFLVQRVGDCIESITWRRAAELVGTCAATLAEKGVRKGDRVAIISENSPEWVIADLAIMTVGAVSVLVASGSLSREDVLTRISDAAPSLVFVSSRRRKALFGDDDRPYSFQMLSMDGMSAEDLSVTAYDPEPVSISDDDICTVIYTSGTTDNPHGVALSYRNYASITGNHSALGIFPDRYTTLCILPLDHCLMHFYLFHVIENGGTMAITRQKDNRIETLIAVEEDLRVFKPDVLVMVPALLYGMTRILKLKKADSSPSAALSFFGGRLKFIITGGAKVEPRLIRELLDSGLRAYPGYGMTETAGGICINTSPDTKADSIGRPIGDSDDIGILSDGGVTDRPGVTGEIVYRGASLMNGYWNDLESTSAAIDGAGWYHTGDLGHFDEDGFLYFDGRVKSLLIAGSGEKYDPQEIEDAIRSASPLISQVMVFNQESPFTIALAVPAGDAGSITEEHITELSVTLKSQHRFSEIWIPKKYLLLDEVFSQSNGFLTSKGDLARHKILLRWKKEIDTIYNTTTNDTGRIHRCD